MQRECALPPIRGSQHQRLELSLDRRVIETLGPEMAAVAKHDFAAVHEKRMIIGREGGEALLDWKLTHNRRDRLQLCAVGDVKPGSASRQTANKTNES